MYRRNVPLSVITIVKGRREHLGKLIEGLEENKVLPEELVIVHMNEKPGRFQSGKFRISEYSIYNLIGLPLAGARNFGARHAICDFCAFLDVDCIPDRDFVGVYHKNLNASPENLLVGPVNYLPEKWKSDGKAELSKMPIYAIKDHIRNLKHEVNYDIFWSLNFGCTKSLFDKVGGFDERYVGYGGEDTDFSYQAEKVSVRLKYVPANVYHQYHESYDPPLNHFDSIVNNAAIFYGKWQKWPMEGWLSAFEEMGLISRNNGQITLLKVPTAFK